ncbi:MAG: hypothetical protein KTR30_13255 [Saprospiraceae bacterium]|nr:hypothetical protein [Saprospiraceae bacterium]
MRKLPGLHRLLFSILLGFILAHCTTDQLRPQLEGKDSIQLRWVKAYEGENMEQVMLGLQWSLSFLGAHLPPETWPQAVQFIDQEEFILDLGKVGFTPSTLAAWHKILERLKASEEYQVKGSIDLSRFLVLSLHSSWHYYELTQVPDNLTAYLAQQEQAPLDSFPIVNSSIATEPRLIRFHTQGELSERYFIADEGKGILGLDQPVDHFEILDILPNGQLRFMLYDESGNLVPAAPLATTRAGKPSKCLWCHEVNVQPLFQPTPNQPGFLTSEYFQGVVDSTNQLLDAYRASLPTELKHSEKQAHTQSELLYIVFMEPSLERVAREWNLSEEATQEILKDFPTHTFAEFPFLGDLYYRNWIDSLAPYRAERPPDSVREPGWEPNFFR